MNKKLSLVIITSLTILVIIPVTFFYFVGVTDKQVVIERMIKFSEVMPNSEYVIKDKEAVKEFAYAVRFADKQPGMVDMPHPDFQFRLGKRQYYLWISEHIGKASLMKLPDTGTLFIISESRKEKLWDILTKEYKSTNPGK